MERKIKNDISKEILVKITDEPFDDVIGHDTGERKYFTIENNNKIYRRLREEFKMYYLPYLGPCVDFGMGDACIEETGDVFKFYVIDRAAKFEYQEFNNIKDAIDCLTKFEIRMHDIDDADKFKAVFYEVLDLE